MSNEKFKTYQDSDFMLNVDDAQMAYHRRKDEDKKGIHWGQRKLLLTLIQFLTKFWDPTLVPNPVLVYAGAAPGTNIKIVSDLFPEVEMHLYDPSKFKIKPTEKIHLYNQYFTDEDAKKWAGRKDVYFVSDIRTADYTTAKDLNDNENQIMNDMKMQMTWFRIIQPVKAHLKFRLPYTGGARPPRVDYLYGHILKQPWAPQTTTESRLVPIGDKVVSWCSQLYQDQMFYHNVVIREQYKYLNPFDDTPRHVDTPELLNDWDSVTEALIWRDYIIKRAGNGGDVDIEGTVLALSKMITHKLTERSKYKDTLSRLRSKPQFIKQRNFRPSRDNADIISRVGRDHKSEYTPLNDVPEHRKPTITPSSVDITKISRENRLASEIGL